MRRLGFIIGIATVWLGVCSHAVADTVGNIVNQVSQSSYQQYLDTLLFTHSGDSRGFSSQHDLAQTNISTAFASFGLTVALDPFQYNSATYYNVVATLPGTTARASEVYIVGAHYDSVGNPGADDNASGVAGVLEAARVLSQHQFEATIKFIAFDREEQGLIGSWAYATAHSTDSIQGMISMDMIAYNPVGAHHDRAWIYGRTASDPIKASLSQAVALYGGLTGEIGGDTPHSDHAPFEAMGFQAALLIEHAVWNNPYYHSAADTVDTPNYIDYAYAAQMTRSTVGYLAASAAAVPEVPASILLLLGGSIVVALYGKRRTA